jgi:XTP/dITP diphosphohydrolase
MFTDINKLVLATRNPDKIFEIRHVLDGLHFDIVSVADFNDIQEVEEDGDTIESNAIKKAQIVSETTGLLSLADDTALEVDFLGGEPGIFSSRYAGERASYADNVRLLLQRLEGVAPQHRTARFRCVMALCKGRKIKTVEGCCEGVIVNEPRGTNGFGYDPVFFIPEHNLTFAEMSITLKNKISHRGIALRKIRRILGGD